MYMWSSGKDLLTCVDVAVVLSGGKVIAKGTPSELVRNPNAQQLIWWLIQGLTKSNGKEII